MTPGGFGAWPLPPTVGSPNASAGDPASRPPLLPGFWRALQPNGHYTDALQLDQLQQMAQK